jgi:hypothetical protein
MTRDLYRHLQKQDLSRESVMTLPLATARKEWSMVRQTIGLTGTPQLLTPPNGSAKAEHGLTDTVPAATWMLYLLPSDASGIWNTCRFATAGCRAACLAESGQQGMETRSGHKEDGHIYRGRLARLLFLGSNPQAFLRILAHELNRLPKTKWASKGFALGFRPNGISDLPFETLVPWLFDDVKASGVTPYDYTAWPTSRRDRATSLVYLVDSVKETHSDADVDAMARPVVVFDVKRNAPLPSVWRGRPVIDADRSDARFLDAEGTVRGLRYKHVATCSKEDAVASGFVRTV